MRNSLCHLPIAKLFQQIAPAASWCLSGILVSISLPWIPSLSFSAVAKKEVLEFQLIMEQDWHQGFLSQSIRPCRLPSETLTIRLPPILGRALAKPAWLSTQILRWFHNVVSRLIHIRQCSHPHMKILTRLIHFQSLTWDTINQESSIILCRSSRK